MNTLSRLGSGLRSAWNAFYDAFSPAQTNGGLAPRAGLYRTRWAYYANTLFEDEALQDSVLRLNGLYRLTRPLYNPTRRAVDLLVGSIYPGMLAADASTLPDGFPTAIPLAADTDPQIRAALAQFWNWANWQEQKDLLVLWGATLGEVLVELVDDVAHGNVYPSLIWPGDVVGVTLDTRGNVKAYTLEYLATDANGLQYRYRKEVNGREFATFREDTLIDRYPNPYGFVPAVWFRHQPIGGEHGAPALYGTLNKIPRLMGLASHIHDQVHKAIGAPAILWTDASPGSLIDLSRRSEDDSRTLTDDDSILLIQGPAGGRVDSLLGALDLGQALALLDSMLTEIEQDIPILKMYDQLRGMSQVTGPAAERLVGDAANAIYKAQAQYDGGSTALFQMALAIGGWRANTGAWGSTLTAAQAVFRPFDLTSYAAGKLNFTILPRPLLPMTKTERATARKIEYDVIFAGVAAGFPLAFVMQREGYNAEDIAQVRTLQRAALVAAHALAASDQHTNPADTFAPGQLIGEPGGDAHA